MLPPPLETDEEKCCLIALVDKNVAMSKEQAKKQLIEHNLRLVVYLAKKFENTGVCVDEPYINWHNRSHKGDKHIQS